MRNSGGRLQQIVKQYRSQLMAHEAQAQTHLDAAYRHVLARIQPWLDALYRDIAAYAARDEKIPASYLYEQHRLKAIQQLVNGEISQYAALARTTTAQLQHVGVSLGLQSSHALLDASKPVGVSYSWGIPSQDALAQLIGATSKGSPLADLFAGFGSEAAQKVGTALISGVSLGSNPRVVARDVQQALGISRNRALVVSRNEMLRCYKSSATANYRANSDVVAQWRWTCDKSDRTCIACLMEDGTLHDIDEDLESHVCCRCTPIPVTRSWADILGDDVDTSNIEDASPDIQSGEDWFNEQPDSVQRSILGNAKYDAWQNGDFELSDIVGRSHDETWGNSIYEKSLKELTA